MTVKVAALQMTSGAQVAENLAQAGRLIEAAAAAGARLVALPENFSFMGLKDADKRAVAEGEDGPVQDFLSATAARLKVWLIGGTTPLRAGADGRVAAASLVFDADGRQVARYDKIHLFDVDIPGRAESYRESAHVAPGARVEVIDTPAGRLGLSVCYDVRFPELYRQLSAAGAQVLVVPSAFTTPTGRAHWETLLRARAIENLCYVIAPAQSGFHPSGRETYGDSMIVDYWGRVLRRVPRGTGYALAEIDIARLSQVRESFPALAHRVFCEGTVHS
jgi:deaminated glutathione amidase